MVEELKRINVNLDEKKHREFKSMVSYEGKTITQKIEEWINRYLKKELN